ncbi:ankyrin repeat domain-containing protein [Gammaproteobacteria bacterium]|nr:ankyrin repeat domain-containing protein [Gammaproteobacteria bacterium]
MTNKAEINSLQLISSGLNIDLAQVVDRIKRAEVSSELLTTPLHLACDQNNLNVVKELFTNKKLHDQKNKKQQTALHIALDKGHIDIINYYARNKPYFTAQQIIKYTSSLTICNFELLAKLQEINQNNQTQLTSFNPQKQQVPKRKVINSHPMTKNNTFQEVFKTIVLTLLEKRKAGLKKNKCLKPSLNQLLIYSQNYMPITYTPNLVLNQIQISETENNTINELFRLAGHAYARHDYNANIAKNQNSPTANSRFANQGDLKNITYLILKKISVDEIKNYLTNEKLDINQLRINAFNSINPDEKSQSDVEPISITETEVAIKIYNIHWGDLLATYSQVLKESSENINLLNQQPTQSITRTSNHDTSSKENGGSVEKCEKPKTLENRSEQKQDLSNNGKSENSNNQHAHSKNPKKSYARKIGAFGYNFYVDEVCLIFKLNSEQKLFIVTCYPVTKTESQHNPDILFHQAKPQPKSKQFKSITENKETEEINKNMECRASPTTVINKP